METNQTKGFPGTDTMNHEVFQVIFFEKGKKNQNKMPTQAES